MPRCYSCGQYTKKPHREIDGRVERVYCDLCHAEREWKFGDQENVVSIEPPPLSWWDRLKRFFSA